MDVYGCSPKLPRLTNFVKKFFFYSLLTCMVKQLCINFCCGKKGLSYTYILFHGIVGY